MCRQNGKRHLPKHLHPVSLYNINTYTIKHVLLRANLSEALTHARIDTDAGINRHTQNSSIKSKKKRENIISIFIWCMV